MNFFRKLSPLESITDRSKVTRSDTETMSEFSKSLKALGNACLKQAQQQKPEPTYHQYNTTPAPAVFIDCETDPMFAENLPDTPQLQPSPGQPVSDSVDETTLLQATKHKDRFALAN